MYAISQLATMARNLLAEQTARFFKTGQIERWLNDAVLELWKIMFTTKADHFVKSLQSSASALTILDRSYSPASLKITSGVKTYTLPPDFISVKYIKPLSDKKAYFYALDRASNLSDYLDIDGTKYSDSFVYDIIGENSLVLVTEPNDTFDIELGYYYRVAPLRQAGDNSGTVAIAVNGTAVVGTGTAFSSTRHVGKRLIAGTIDVGRIYPYVVSVADATNLTLSSNYSDVAVAAGTVYTLDDSIPVPMMDYHTVLVDYAVMRARMKDKATRSFREFFEMFNRGEMRTKEAAESRQHMGSNMVDPYLCD